MSAYFVRLAETNEVVGLFCAQSLAELAHIVDAACPVDDCEYAPAGSGGVFVDHKTPATWPMPECSEDEGERPTYQTGLEGARLSDNWLEKLSRGGLKWRRLSWVVEA